MDERSNTTKLTMSTPAGYRIVVRGCLDEQWSDRLAGLKITLSTIGEDCVLTELSGQVLDQAALLGVLNALYNLHYPLISVELHEQKEEKE